MIASHPARERMFRFPPARRVLALPCLRGGGGGSCILEFVYKHATRFVFFRQELAMRTICVDCFAARQTRP